MLRTNTHPLLLAKLISRSFSEFQSQLRQGGRPPAEASQCPSVADGGGPVHVHGLVETNTPSAVQQEAAPDGAAGAHLHVQLQDVGVRLQQLTHVGFGASKVPVDKLFDVPVG